MCLMQCAIVALRKRCFSQKQDREGERAKRRQVDAMLKVKTSIDVNRWQNYVKMRDKKSRIKKTFMTEKLMQRCARGRQKVNSASLRFKGHSWYELKLQNSYGCLNYLFICFIWRPRINFETCLLSEEGWEVIVVERTKLRENDTSIIYNSMTIVDRNDHIVWLSVTKWGLL